MPQLLNKADVTGTFDGVPVENYSELSVELSALSITKMADKMIWVKDELTYTIVVTNIDARDPGDPLDPGLPVLGVEIKDIIDPAIATLVTDSVEIDGDPATIDVDYTFDLQSGLLTVLFASIAPGSSHTITFQVEMV